MIKHEKHIDKRAKNSEKKFSAKNSNEFLRSLVKSLKKSFCIKILSFKMRNLKGLKNDIFDQQS